MNRTTKAVVVCAGALAIGAAVWSYVVRRGPSARVVVVITLDTFRADAISSGNTPALDLFLQDARRYRGARTVVPLTLPSHVSMFTGLLPCHHGIHDNTGMPVPSRDDRPFPLLAEELRDAGYITHALVSSAVLAPKWGLDAGFATYDWDDSGFSGTSRIPYRQAGRQVDRALAVLERHKSDRLFLWVHLFDPHEPRVAFRGDAARAGTGASDTDRELYFGEIRRVDAALERLLAAIPDDALVVVVSDHGEGLGDHGEQDHGPVCFGSTIDALLAIRGPGIEPGVDRAPRSVCDVAPTIRVSCGLDEEDGDGGSVFDPPKEVVFSESLLTYRQHGWGQCFAVTDGRFTLVESGADVALYDRRTDPGERRPLALEGHAAYETLDRALSWYRTASNRTGPDAKTLASVSAYGTQRRPFSDYLARSENAKRPNPVHRLEWGSRMMPLSTVVYFAVLRHDENVLRQAVPELEALAQEDEWSPEPFAWLAGAYRVLGDPVRGVKAALTALDRGLVVSSVLREAVVCAARTKDSESLAKALRIAVSQAIVPEFDCARALHDAWKNGDASARCVRELLERSRARLEPKEQSEIDGWLRALGRAP